MPITPVAGCDHSVRDAVVIIGEETFRIQGGYNNGNLTSEAQTEIESLKAKYPDSEIRIVEGKFSNDTHDFEGASGTNFGKQ